MSNESLRWYNRDLTLAETVAGAKKGTLVKPDIRHAVKYGLLYNVTGICSAAEGFFGSGLDQWKMEQVALACKDNPWDGVRSTEDYVALVLAKADEYRKVTADRGKDIHGAVEEAFKRNVPPEEPASRRAYLEISEWLKAHEITEVTCEKALGGWELGFCGTPDIYSTKAILDMKTTNLAKFHGSYPKWKLQLGGYSILSLSNEELWQAVIDRDTGETRFIQHEDANLWRERFQYVFEALCKCKGYDPRVWKQPSEVKGEKA